MFRLALSLCLPVALSLPPSARADAPRAEGHIESDEGRVEILGRPFRVGERVELPEGFLRIEEQGKEDEDVGSFGVVPAGSFGGPAATAPAEDVTAEDPAPAGATGPASCDAERDAYLSELWRESGIEVSSPDAILRGLRSGEGSAAGFHWFALASDPFRPLAWSSTLRERAEALVRCVRGD